MNLHISDKNVYMSVAVAPLPLRKDILSAVFQSTRKHLMDIFPPDADTHAVPQTMQRECDLEDCEYKDSKHVLITSVVTSVRKGQE